MRAWSVVVCAAFAACSSSSSGGSASTDPVLQSAQTTIEEGRQTFRYETFGDEAFWGDTVKLHQAISPTRKAASTMTVASRRSTTSSRTTTPRWLSA